MYEVQPIKEQLKHSQCYWDNVLWSDGTMAELLTKKTQHYVCTVCVKLHCIPTCKHHPIVKYGGSATGP